ncbi:complex I subunit 5 family protein [Acidiferrimicrobium sp. IK]|uniref:complex I subunit 5 family protein n=1 Tax=Acidiferrimicrobium sp. IK TaxID=2871700 RepID=UPI0021CAF56E|nr:complex I subunit 5 family protein [Acidiferrimicrobium sp. IK]MCU4182775.1 complex I subunit 5 family protein [Acidiferrimicrobium sp. IK]
MIPAVAHPAPGTVLAPLAVAVPLAAAAVLAGANQRIPALWRDLLGSAAAATATVLAGVVLSQAAHRRVVYWFGGWRPVHGTVIGVDYAVDPMGGALAVLAGVLALAALVYSRRFFGETGGRYPALVLVFTAASIDFAWTGDLFNMFVAFELVAVTGFILTGFYAEEEAPLQGAINFAVLNTVGGLVVLTGVALLYGHTGTLNLAQMGQTLAGHRPGGLVVVAFALLASGFLVKAGSVPWHFWLPDAYGTAPAPASILIAGVTSELGLFGLARTWETVFSGAVAGSAEQRIRLVLGALGVLTALVGTAMALAEDHPRRLLAFVVIAHLGVYLLGFSLLRTAALGGVALLAAGDGFVKGALFLAVGIIRRHRRATGARALRGEGPAITIAAGVIVLGVLCLSDLPPFSSSVGKDLLVATAGSAGPLVEAVIAVTVVGSGAAILASAVQVWQGHAVDNPSPSEDAAETAAGWGNVTLLAPPVVLLAAALGLGLVPHLADHAASAAASFADRPGYHAAVYGAARRAVARPGTGGGGVEPLVIDGAEAAASVLAAAALVSRRRIAPVLGRGTGWLRDLHRGHLGDQLTWAVLGMAAMAAASGLALR